MCRYLGRMKPEKGSEDMEDEVWDPLDLFVDVGLLVTEARTPDLSVKGRVEGPHCPPIQGTSLHQCDKHREQCRKADQLRKQMVLLYRNNIPMRIDVLLLPDCNHGHLEASTVEGANLSHPENSEKNGGLYAPGESVSHTFSDKQETHTFPVADLSHVAVRVAVTSLPRQETVPHVNCREEENAKGASQLCKMSVHRKTDREKELSYHKFQQESPKSMTIDHVSEFIKKEDRKYNVTRTIPKTDSQKFAKDVPQQTIPRTMMHKPPTGRSQKFDFPKTTDFEKDSQKNVLDNLTLLEKGESKSHQTVKVKQNPKDMFREKPLVFPQQEAFGSGIMGGMKRLPSPKVLFTCSNNRGPQTFYKKRHIDLGQPGDKSENLEEKVMTGKLKDLVQPLNAEEIEAYLSSLSHRNTGTGKAGMETSLDNIPLTKCKFYIGENNSEKDKKTKFEGSDECKPDLDSSFIGTSTAKNTQEEYKFTFNKPEQNIHHQDSNNDPLVRNLFLKSFSEPGPSFEHLELSEENQSVQVGPEREIPSQIDGYQSKQSLKLAGKISNGNSPEDGELSDGEGSSYDSTPTNSLSETNGVMTSSCGLKDKIDFGVSSGLSSRELTPTIELETKYENKKCDNNLEKKFSTMTINSCAKASLSSLNNFQQNIENRKTESKTSCDSSQTQDYSGNLQGPKDLSLCKKLLTKELQKNLQNEALTMPNTEKMPDQDEILQFRKNLGRSASMMFSTATGLPTQSSPAPVKRKSTGRFDYDSSLISTRAIKNALSCSKLVLQSESRTDKEDNPKVLSTSAPASTNCLLGNFEESVLNGRIEPVGVVEGFKAEIGAGGAFCPKHLKLPVTAYFFQLSDDNAPSPYLGHINLEPVGKKGYHIPKCGTLQITLFNPNKTVVKMFVVMYDLSDMPPNCQTFLRQRTVYMPVDPNSCEPSYLRYLVHLRFASSKSGKVYLHTDIRLIFARDKFEFDPKVANYELRSFTEGPQNPKFSPKRIPFEKNYF
ncbi:hypothetical protein KUTeg_010728 [Tegillarca granosa]|uniref:Atos-like conserved domain-containing protein n=1 Tax=Tegillarca granosa TaxID=220873 RepID=A0ABQ9F1V3_TEGGR|nr:hypothetical protein KUTeg_010728 [Tegillarca granosa]